MRIHEITTAGVKPLPYDPAAFTFGKNKLSPQTWGDLGHGGVRFFSNLNSPSYKDELVVFTGATYFRALGMGQRYGVSARGLAVDTAGGGKEEFPRFTDFWLEKPAADAKQLTVYALMDSERMTGAYRFDITPGEQTTTQVQARIFMRPAATSGNSAAVATLGIAPLTSMFFSGENQPRPGDFRPEVHDSDGLMMATGDGEWLWRPLQNPSATVTTSFSMKSLKGFGLMQRDRSFASYEDTEARYELRPSAWVTPVGRLGPGPRRVAAVHHARRDARQRGGLLGARKNAGPRAVAGHRLADQLAGQEPAAAAQRLGHAVAPRHRLFKAGHRPHRPGPVHRRLCRPGAGHPARGRQGRSRLQRQCQRPRAGKPGLQKPRHRRMAHGTARAALNPAQPVELRAFLKHDNHTVSETWTNLITP